MRHKTHLSISCISLILLAGCGSTVEVVPLSKGAKEVSAESGVPYYLPMPCMLITKNISVTRTIIQQSSDNSANQNTDEKKAQASGTKQKNANLQVLTVKSPIADANKDHYEFQIIYLPDIDKQYGIRITKGTGTFNGNIKLEDGWKLTELNAVSDAQTKDIITAAGSAVPNIISAFKSLQRFSPFEEKPKEKIAPSQELWIYRIEAGGSLKPIFYWNSNDRKIRE